MRLIDATEAIRFAEEQIEKETGAYSKGRNTGLRIMESALNNPDAIKTVDAVPVRHGRWEYVPGDGKFRAILICSRCRRNVVEYNRFNYCPHCGAKMDLEEHNGTDNP